MTVDLLPLAAILPPRQAAEHSGLVHTTPARLQAWIESQLSRDLETTATLLLQVLRDINRTEIEPDVLAGLLDLLETRIAPRLAPLEQRMRQLPIPLGRKSRSLATLHAGLVQELAILHLQVLAAIAASAEGSAAPTDRPATPANDLIAPAISVHLRRAARLSGQACLHFWRLYQPLPAGLWRQVHGILVLAEGLGLLTAPPTEAEADGEASLVLPAASVAQITAQLAVLSATAVPALQQGEVDALARWLAALPLRCVEAQTLRSDGDLPLLRLLLQEDRPPSLVLGQPEGGDHVRYVDLAPVVTAIRRLAEPTTPGTGPWHPGRNGLDRRLLHLWVATPKRQYSREPADAGPLVTVTGLQDIHALIQADYRHQKKVAMHEATTGLKAFRPYDGRPERTSAAFANSLRDPDEAHAFTLEGHPPRPSAKDAVHWLTEQGVEPLTAAWNAAVQGIDLRTEAGHEGAAPPVLRPSEALLKDLGAGGLSLHLSEPAQKIFSGDLIAIRTRRQQRVLWQLGQIRWLRYADADGITVGIQSLAAVCVPTRIQLLRGTLAHGPVQSGLFFRTQGTPRAGALVFTPGAFAAGARVVFRLAGEDHTVALESVRLESHTFSRADFPLPTSAPNAEPPA